MAKIRWPGIVDLVQASFTTPLTGLLPGIRRGLDHPALLANTAQTPRSHAGLVRLCESKPGKQAAVLDRLEPHADPAQAKEREASTGQLLSCDLSWGRGSKHSKSLLPNSA